MKNTIRIGICCILFMGGLMISGCGNGSTFGNNPAVENSVSTYSTDNVNKLSEEGRKKYDKLLQIKKEFSVEQVHELLGQPDEIPATGLYRDVYILEENIRATLIYFSDTIRIEIFNSDSDEREVVVPK